MENEQPALQMISNLQMQNEATLLLAFFFTLFLSDIFTSMIEINTVLKKSSALVLQVLLFLGIP